MARGSAQGTAAKKSITRMYQGRITAAYRLGKKDSLGPALENWEERLWEFHELFQDAVNYYLVCFAAMCRDNEPSKLRGFVERIHEAWPAFTRAGRNFKGLRKSLAPYLQLAADATVNDAFGRIVSSDSCPSALCAALVQITEEAKGDIQQSSKENFARCCDPLFSGNWGTTKKRKDEARKIHLPRLLYCEGIEDHLKELEAQLKFDDFANQKNSAGTRGVLDEARRRTVLTDAVEFLASRHHYVAAQKGFLLELIGALPRDTVIYAYQPGSINKASLKGAFYSYLLFSKIDTSTSMLAVLRSYFKRPKTITRYEDYKADSKIDTKEDPLQRARGDRGVIFPAFTATWGRQEKQRFVWKEFDIAAFAEALKCLNQFAQKTDDREEQSAKKEAELRYMLEGVPNPSTGDLEESPGEEVTFAGDSRLTLAKELQGELSVALPSDEDLYRINRRALRGFDKLTKQWHKIVSIEPNPTADRLIDCVTAAQQSDPFGIGDVNLFRKLSQPKYWPLWRAPNEDEARVWEANNWSFSFLYDYCRCLKSQEDHGDLRNRRVRLTPADAVQSPRYCMLSDCSKVRLLRTSGSPIMAVDIALRTDDGWDRHRIALKYSAPRLLRDHLSADPAQWIPPMLTPFAGDTKFGKPKDKKPAASLMLRKDARGIRPLIGLPTTIEVSRPFGPATWAQPEKQFRTIYKDRRVDKILGLDWPTERQTEAITWPSRSNLSCLGVDLGQRYAAATALVVAKPSVNESSKGRFIGTIANKDWYAEAIQRRILRLPGEYSGEEGFGASKRGRSATAAETREARSIVDKYVCSSTQKWRLSINATQSFPEQNGVLLRALRQGRDKLRNLQRWSWMMNFAEYATALREETANETFFEEWREGKLVTAQQYTRLTLAIEELRRSLVVDHLVVAQRCAPLIGKRREWQYDRSQNYYSLVEVDDSTVGAKIRGQRGLSLGRLEQLEGLRKAFQSLNQLMRQEIGVLKVLTRKEKQTERETIPDCCPDLRERVQRLKDERIRLTAHLIIAEALGVRLKEHEAGSEPARKIADIHGEYERIPGRQPVDFIVLEDLVRYQRSQDRSPSENRRLMEWCHRALLAKLKELCEPIGLFVLEVDAAFSSRFCSATGVAGFRADELNFEEARQKFSFDEDQDDPNRKALRSQFARVPYELERTGKYRLLVPNRAGRLFIPIAPETTDPIKHRITHADQNAAANVALRAIASPFADDVFTRVRTVMQNGVRSLRLGNKRERSRWSGGAPIIQSERPETPGSIGDHSSFFFDVSGRIKSDHVFNPSTPTSLVSGVALWSRVQEDAWKICLAMNDRRLEKWTGKMAHDEVEISVAL